MKKLLMAAAALVVATAGAVSAESWTLDGEASRLAFGSVKKDTVGEVHSFGGLTGSVGTDGAVTLDIDLGTVETNIDIRNERMVEHVFKGIASAQITAAFDMSEVNGLAVGESTTVYVDPTLNLLGAQVELEAEMFVVRTSETQVMVMTNDMIFLNTADAGIDAGIDKLMELAELPGITRTSPVTLRLVFNLDDQKAEAAPAADVTQVAAVLTGDAKKGRRVFNKCKACHQVKEGRNSAGPSLYGIFGATAGQTEGFGYSNEMVASGIVWDAATLAEFLANPKDIVPGTSMSFVGLKKPEEIDDVLAYLAEETAAK